MNKFIIYITIILLIAGFTYAAETTIDISSNTNLATSTGVSLTNDTVGLVLGEIDHDSLLNFAADEHLDWTASVGTIHTDNYVENATHTGDVTGSGALTIAATSSAIWAGRITDETGTGLIVFATSPTFTTGITVPANSISDDELDEGAAFDWTGVHSFGVTTTLATSTITDLTISSDISLPNDVIDAADIDTINCGRSTTWDATNDEVDLDAEIYSESFSIVVKNATTTSNPVAAHPNLNAITITKVQCSDSAGTTTIQLDERVQATPFSAGTDILTSALACGTGIASTTAFDNSAIAANAYVSLDIDSVVSSTSTIITIFYTIDD